MTTTIHAPTGDEDVITFGGIRRIYSRELGIQEVTSVDGTKIEIRAPGRPDGPHTCSGRQPAAVARPVDHGFCR
jgi:hypothetical protein